ncbi:MAG TPA: histidine ammonia-lyase, partial [Candidatus Thorarchaeota archaeon]|nr:histidine ammonia-lyase [Candidatus Thorarchaeota archaeon]
PTSAEQEDHVSMGTIAARKARQILENVKNVVAIEYLCAAQGLDLLAPLRPSEALERAHALIRTVVPELTDDRPLYSDIVKIRQLMDCGEIVSAVESVTGALYEV